MKNEIEDIKIKQITTKELEQNYKQGKIKRKRG